MSVVGHEAPSFFKRGPAPLARLAFFVVLSLLLLVLDLRYHTMEWSRQGVAIAIYPMERLAYLPVAAINQLGEYFSSLRQLQLENAELRRRQLGSATVLLRQTHLEQEIQRLRTLLDMKERQPVSGQIAEIMYAARDPFTRRVVIDKGTRQGLWAGQAVIDEKGVIGQVTRTYPMLSEVTLITDKEQAVPVQIARNGIRSIVFGTSAGGLELRFLPENADVVVGDVLVTSGLDGIYVPGLPVARVTQVDRDARYIFARIMCQPIAGVERHRQVLVLGRGVALPAPPPAHEAHGKSAKTRQERK